MNSEDPILDILNTYINNMLRKCAECTNEKQDKMVRQVQQNASFSFVASTAIDLAELRAKYWVYKDMQHWLTFTLPQILEELDHGRD